jgi:autotransporter passenger strand-loop-strand repeat protein
VQSGRTLLVSYGGAVSGATVEKGGTIVFAGGVVSGLKLKTGAIEAASAGGVIVASSGKTLRKVDILAGGEIVFAGGKVNALTISNGGTEGIASGTTMRGLTIDGGATLVVSAGGTASGTTLKSGYMTVHLAIAGFDTTDTLDLSGFSSNQLVHLSFKENAAKTSGVLKITDGSLSAQVTLFGQYAAAGFRLAFDGSTGTLLTYTPPKTAHEELAPHH